MAYDDFNKYLEEILAAVYGQDVRQSIHDAIRQCYLDGRVGAVDLTAREAIEREIANRAKDVSGETTKLESEIVVERNRINNMTKLQAGSTTGDAELLDARVGANGIIYESTGVAIREQIKHIGGSLKSINLANPDKFTIGKYCNNEGAIRSDTKYFYTEQIPVVEGDVFSCTGSRFVTAYKYDEKGTLIPVPNSGIDGNPTIINTYEVPEGEGIVALVFTGWIADRYQYMINRGDTRLEYQPYNVVPNGYDEIYNHHDQLVQAVDFLSDTSDVLTEIPVGEIQTGYIGMDEDGSHVRELPDYNHYVLTLSPGTYSISGPHYKGVRLYALTRKSGDIIKVFPRRVDWEDPKKYDHDDERFTITEDCDLYVNVLNSAKPPIVSKVTKQITVSDNIKRDNGDILYNKKWAICGDSFSAGDFSGLSNEDTKLTDGPYKGKNKVYGYLIGTRVGMIIQDLTACGRTLSAPSDTSFTNIFSTDMYKSIDDDVDYITLYFGINDSHKNVPIGTINDKTNTTFCGAWNVVLEYLMANRPYAHIGILVSNGCDTDEYPKATIEIAKKWGIPYIDLNGDEHTPVMIRSTNSKIASSVRVQKTKTFRVSATNQHPNIKAHEYESTFIENFLRSI